MNGKQLFTIQQSKVILRIDCTVEQIWHLLVKYKGSRYADEASRKWNEVDGLFEEEITEKRHD
jgi:hypothetical protein